MRVYLIFDTEKKALELEKVAKDFNVDIIGKGKLNKATLQNIALGSPDVVFCDEYEINQLREICDISRSIIVIMRSPDLNRCNDAQNTLNQEGYRNFNFIDSSQFGATATFEILISNYDNLIANIQDAIMNDEANDFEFVEEDGEGNSASVDLGTIDNLPAKDISLPEENKEQSNEPKEEKSNDDDVLIDNSNDPEVKENEFKERLQKEENSRFGSVASEDANSRIINGIQNNVEYNTNTLIMRTKIIHIHSKKGGTGKSTLIKELAYKFSRLRLAKKVNRQNEYFSTCIVDLDFERGNQRTLLGVEQVSPNVYDWLEDIITNLEKGIKFENIKYNNLQILSRFVKKIDDNLSAVLNGKGGIPQRLFDRILHLQQKDENVLKSICEKIIESLRGVFDIIIIDSGCEFDECTLASYELADTNLIVVNPTLSSIETAKEELEDINRINGASTSISNQTINTNTLAVILNMDRTKTSIDDDMDEILSFLTVSKVEYEDDVPKMVSQTVPLAGRVAYDPNLIGYENECLFISADRNTTFGRSLDAVASYILPMYKINNTRMQNAMKIRKEIKAREEEKKPAFLKKKKKEKKNVRENVLEKTIEDLKGYDPDENYNNDEELEGDTLISDDDSNNQETVDTVENIIQDAIDNPVVTVKEFIYQKFDKKITVEQFVEMLKNVEGVKTLSTGYPVLEIKPKYLPNKVYKKYLKIVYEKSREARKAINN